VQLHNLAEPTRAVMTTAPLKLCLFGAATDTSNLGVSALCYSTLTGIARRARNAEITVFDNGRGMRPSCLRLGNGEFFYRLCGAYNSRRYYRPESYWNMRASSWLGGVGNPGAMAFLESKAILDVSGGDSFCDLYGAKVFRSNTIIKRMALARGLPLILLPQTYGPFQDARHRAIAQDVVRRAAAAWARDRQSFGTLRELLGSAFDPARHLCGVDLAFGLEPRRPKALPLWLLEAIEKSNRQFVGLNISGLIHNDPSAAKLRYGFKADYRQVIQQLLTRLLNRTDRSVVIVPHVLASRRHIESDSAASEAAIEALPRADQKRVFLLPRQYDPSETKWIVSQTEWFCGTRMHSAIAALSSGVPCAAIAYSLKTAGVFESCGQGGHVADPRRQTTEEVVEQLWASWENRDLARRQLSDALVGVFQTANSQMDTLVRLLHAF
jgi:colanic acid/amylovoran biosynthesis protein WcaK/AmsJ